MRGSDKNTSDIENKTLGEWWGWDTEHYTRRQLSKEERWRWKSETEGEGDGQSCGNSGSVREWLRREWGVERSESEREREVRARWRCAGDSPSQTNVCLSTWQTCFSSAWLSSTLLSLWLITRAYHHASAGRHILHDNYVHRQTHCMITMKPWNRPVSEEASMNCIYPFIRK